MAHPLSAGLTIKSSSVLRVWIACSSSLDIFATTRTALFSRFQDAFRDIIRQLSNGELDEDGVDSIIFHLEQLSVHLVRLCNVDLMNNQTERLISNTIMLLRSYNNVNRQASSFQLERKPSPQKCACTPMPSPCDNTIKTSKFCYFFKSHKLPLDTSDETPFPLTIKVGILHR